MASKDLSFGQKFALYAGAAVLGAGLPFALDSQMALSDAELFESVRQDVITNKVSTPLKDQIKQAVDGVKFTTASSYNVNIQSQQTLDLKALEEEVVAKVAEQKAGLQENNLIMSPLVALIGLVGVFHVRTMRAQSRKRAENAPKP